MTLVSASIWIKLAALACASLLLYQSLRNEAPTIQAEGPKTDFEYNFDWEGSLSERESSAASPSPYWWLDSGGELTIRSGIGFTLQGELEGSDRWRRLYADSNPADTDGGKRPQNLFRLMTKSAWLDFEQSVRVRIDSHNLSESPNRNESNGILLLSRYLDEDNLYYAGLRVDGHAVIKKKYDGIYYTLAEKAVIPGSYDREEEPSLLREGEWLTLKSNIETLPDGSVLIVLDREVGGEWQELLRAADDGLTAPPILKPGHAGIRTDFMDASFEDYAITIK